MVIPGLHYSSPTSPTSDACCNGSLHILHSLLAPPHHRTQGGEEGLHGQTSCRRCGPPQLTLKTSPVHLWTLSAAIRSSLDRDCSKVEDAWAYVLCVTFESAKKQYISFTYVCMYMCMYIRTYIHTDTHTFMHMCVNPTLQCTAARTGESSNHEISAPAAASCFPSTQL